MSTETFDYVDGNAAAGALQELFAVEPTTIRGQCASCSRISMLADTRVYFGGPGLVMRCRGCGSELLSLATTPEGTWLEVSGLTRLDFPAGG
jgi:ribosomal protein S27E